MESRFAGLLGGQVRKDSGLGVVEDIDALKRSVTIPKQQIADLTEQMDVRQQELDAARVAIRNLMTPLDQPT